MQIKIGEIYKVKPEFRNVCGEYNYFTSSAYICYADNPSAYVILDKSKNYLSSCCNCFKPKHLEPLEKTLYNLEIGDVVRDSSGEERKVVGLIESSPEDPLYILCYNESFQCMRILSSAKELENKCFEIVQPEPIEEIKEMTVEEVSKLVGKKVKIVE